MSRLPPLPIFTLKGDMAAVNCIDYISPDLLCAGTTEGMLHFWDLTTKRERYKVQAGQESCLALFNMKDEIVTQEKGGTIRIWSSKGSDFVEKATIKCSYVGFCKAAWNHPSEHDIYMFAPSEDSTIDIISLKSLKVISSLKTISEKLGEIMALKYFEMEGSPFLLSAYESGHVYLWDLNIKKCLSELKFNGTPMDLDFDPQKRIGVLGTDSNVISIFKFDSNTNVLSLFKTIEITNPGVSCTRLRPDGKLLSVGCWDGRIRLFSWKTLKPLAVLAEHQETIHDVFFSKEPIPSISCHCLMAVAGKDQCISLWDVFNN